MNIVDATDREAKTDEGVPASVLTIILDTNPHAWSLIADELPLNKIIASLLVFINAHLAISDSNSVSIIASHVQRAQWLYPTPTPSLTGSDGEDRDMPDADDTAPPAVDASKYRPFADIEHALVTNLRSLMSTTSEQDLASSPSTMIAGALTMALSYLSKLIINAPARTTSANNYDNFSSVANDETKSGNTASLTSRILIVSVSGDLASQYIPVMNSIFACQRLSIAIDILKLAGDTVFLQQAADATEGVYIAPSVAQKKGLLQHLMMAYLSDASARQSLVLPSESQGVDFRAACFCHRRVVDIGFVCSICLSIFCEPVADNTCLTCGTHLKLTNYGIKPVVVPRKKAKKRKQVVEVAA